jgi:hypothetical protein
LLLELKTLVPTTNAINTSSESSRELFYHHSSIFNTSILHSLLSNINYNSSGLPLNTDFINKYLLTYLTGNNNVNNVTGDHELFKSQYRPMKKGVTNMIRLQATNAIAMPTEIRLHILASSKDIIHS